MRKTFPCQVLCSLKNATDSNPGNAVFGAPPAPAPVSPPTPSPTPSPPGPPQCRCLHNAGSTNGPSYCYQPVQTPAGNSTSTDCVPPAGYGCTATTEYAAQVRKIFPVPGPFYKCNGEVLSTA